MSSLTNTNARFTFTLWNGAEKLRTIEGDAIISRPDGLPCHIGLLDFGGGLLSGFAKQHESLDATKLTVSISLT